MDIYPKRVLFILSRQRTRTQKSKKTRMVQVKQWHSHWKSISRNVILLCSMEWPTEVKSGRNQVKIKEKRKKSWETKANVAYLKNLNEWRRGEQEGWTVDLSIFSRRLLRAAKRALWRFIVSAFSWPIVLSQRATIFAWRCVSRLRLV